MQRSLEVSRPRYALYFAPRANSELARLGQTWLGSAAADSLPGITFEVWQEVTQFPRHYGLHATLKPPFEMMDGVADDELLRDVQSFAKTQTTFTLPKLKLARLGQFFALTLGSECPPLNSLADACVERFDSFRRAPTAEELDRRRPGLNARENELLDRWGYPYVFDTWKFHVTLTGPISHEARAAHVEALLREITLPAREETQVVESISIFRQPNRESPFEVFSRVPFGE